MQEKALLSYGIVRCSLSSVRTCWPRAVPCKEPFCGNDICTCLFIVYKAVCNPCAAFIRPLCLEWLHDPTSIYVYKSTLFNRSLLRHRLTVILSQTLP